MHNAFVYRGAKTREISFPLGGIGTGCLGLAGTGRLIDWEIFNRPAKGSVNGFSHFAIKAETAAGELLDARVLHGDEPAPYHGSGRTQFGGFGFGVSRETMAGLPHFPKTEFRGAFPLAEVEFADPLFPCRFTLAAFNPFIPLQADDSSLPAAFFEFTVANPTDQTIAYTLAMTVKNPYGENAENSFQNHAGISQLKLRSLLPAADLKYGDLTLATDAADTSVQEYWYRGKWFDTLTVFWKDFIKPGPIANRTLPVRGNDAGNDHGTLAARISVAAGQTARVRFLLAWNNPNCSNYWNPPPAPKADDAEPAAGGCCGQGCNCGGKDNAAPPAPTWKNHYATRFADSAATAAYAFQNWDRLETATRQFQETLFASTLPRPVLDAVSANISILKTPTCLRLEDGSFYGWEGCGCDSGCCEGSCTHVWNYAYALPFLFPDLERSMRNLDYRHNLRDDGGMPFRLQLPLGRDRSTFRPCADGQFGGVIKVYRDWKISGDTAWLRTLWPGVKQSIAFAWAPTNEDQWDPERTGVLNGRQHHTLDMELFGPNSWLTGFYLGALKAGAEMAEACGEPDTAAEYRAIFARGRDWVDRNLFNGDYFFQKIDLANQAMLAPFAGSTAGYPPAPLLDTYWSPEHGELKYQVGDGCGIDQVVAQWHADLCGLGDLFDPAKTRSALTAIHRHNYKPSMRGFFNPCRLYCLNDEAGTTMFDWPEGKRKPMIPIPYAEETMHGFEYMAGSHLIRRGLVAKGLAMVKAVRDRYDGERRNPWNEIECGSNYARSMAAYALLNACSGFEFDRTRGMIGFAPARLPRAGTAAFACFWALDGAWGRVTVTGDTLRLEVLAGRLEVAELRLPATLKQPGRALGARLEDAAGERTPTAPQGTTISAGRRQHSRPVLNFTPTVVLTPGQTLCVVSAPPA
ncbi:MAG: GH116 family glycosyl-hydrolase [Lentisphaeria bacterium]